MNASVVPSLPIAPTDSRRRLALTGTHNFRDVGGYPTEGGGRTRWGVLYRSDGLDSLTSADHDVLADRGIKTVLDLRDEDEFLPSPDALGDLPARHVSIPIFENSLFKIPADTFPGLEDHYRKILREHTHQLAAAIQVFGEPDALPGIVHCTAGKDRTGLVTALMLSIAGVPDEWIVRDYEASQAILGDDFVRKVEVLYDEAGFERSMLHTPTASPARYLVEALDELRDRHGSLEQFLADSGVSEASIARIRAALVQSPRVRVGEGEPR